MLKRGKVTYRGPIATVASYLQTTCGVPKPTGDFFSLPEWLVDVTAGATSGTSSDSVTTTGEGHDWAALFAKSELATQTEAERAAAATKVCSLPYKHNRTRRPRTSEQRTLSRAIHARLHLNGCPCAIALLHLNGCPCAIALLHRGAGRRLSRSGLRKVDAWLLTSAGNTSLLSHDVRALAHDAWRTMTARSLSLSRSLSLALSLSLSLSISSLASLCRCD